MAGRITASEKGLSHYAQTAKSRIIQESNRKTNRFTANVSEKKRNVKIRSNEFSCKMNAFCYEQTSPLDVPLYAFG